MSMNGDAVSGGNQLCSQEEAFRKMLDGSTKKLAITPDLQKEVADRLALIILASLGTGISLRGAQGLWRYAAGPMKGRPPQFGHPITIAGKKKDKDKNKAAEYTAKQADIVSDLVKNIHSKTSGGIQKLLRFADRLPSGHYFGGGDYAKSPKGVPFYWLWPALAGASLYGGFAGTDKVLDKVRGTELKEEVLDLETEYKDLVEDIIRKRDSAGNKKSAVDELADQHFNSNNNLTKSGEWGDLKGMPGGAWLLYALLASTIPGYFTYKKLREKSKAKIMQEAREERAKMLQPVVPQMFHAELDSL